MDIKRVLSDKRLLTGILILAVPIAFLNRGFIFPFDALAAVLMLLYLYVFSNKQKIPYLIHIIFMFPFLCEFIGTLSMGSIILHIIPIVLILLGVLKGLHNKLLVVIPIAFEIVLGLINLISWGSIIAGYYVSYILVRVALILFAVNNTIPAIIKPNPQKLSTEGKLKLLRKQLDCGEITEEEYKSKRAEIISNI